MWVFRGLYVFWGLCKGPGVGLRVSSLEASGNLARRLKLESWVYKGSFTGSAMAGNGFLAKRLTYGDWAFPDIAETASESMSAPSVQISNLSVRALVRGIALTPDQRLFEPTDTLQTPRHPLESHRSYDSKAWAA